MLARTPQVIPTVGCRGSFIKFVGCPHYQGSFTVDQLQAGSYTVVLSVPSPLLRDCQLQNMIQPAQDVNSPLEVPIFLQGLQKQHQVTLFSTQLLQIRAYPRQYKCLVIKYHSRSQLPLLFPHQALCCSAASQLI